MGKSKKTVTCTMNDGDYEAFERVCREKFGGKSMSFVLRLLVNYFTNGKVKIEVVPVESSTGTTTNLP